MFGRQPVIDRGGSYADFVVVGEDDAVRTPPGVSQAHAACMGVAGLTAWQAVATLGRVTARPRGASVLVVGASGGVGSIVVQVAAKLGARVTAVCSGHNADFVKHLGAAEVVDYTKVCVCVRVRGGVVAVACAPPAASQSHSSRRRRQKTCSCKQHGRLM